MYHVNAQGVDERIVNKCTLLLFRYATLASIPTCKPRLKTEDQLLETCNQSSVSVISDDVVTRKVIEGMSQAGSSGREEDFSLFSLGFLSGFTV